jgi:hypothetical protein
MDRRILAACAGVVSAAAFCSQSNAAPYAAHVTENAGVISFRLNEQTDQVTVIRDGVPQNLGALGPGSHSFNRNAAAQYQIVVSRNGAPGFLDATGPNQAAINQISNDANPLLNFPRTPGIAVNMNPNNGALFGRVYATSSVAEITFNGRPVGDGVYVLNSDLTDALGQGDNALTGGWDWSSGATSAATPWRVALDNDSNVYIADWSDETGTVVRTGPDVGNSGATNLLVGLGGDASVAPFAPSSTQNHGSIGGLAITGSTSGGNLTLYTIDEDMSPTATPDMLNGLWRYNIGGTTSGYNGIPTFGAAPLIDDFAPGGIIVDLSRGPDGKSYMMQSRFAGTEPGIVVVDSDGSTVLYDSLSDSINRGIDVVDVFRLSRGIEVSPDGQYLAINTSNNGDVWIVPLLDGIPDMPNRLLLDAFLAGTGDGVTFDAAGNLYAGNRTDQLLKVFSAGGPSQTIYTSNGSATFSARQGPEWNNSAGGNYSSGANWLLGVVPNGANARATFGGAVSGSATVTLDQNVTLGDLRFAGPGSYTIAGTSTLTLDSFGEPRVTVIGGGNHTISAPVVSTHNIQFTVTPPTSTLTLTNFTMNNPANTSITTAGAGTTALNRFGAATLNVNRGVAKVLPNGTAAATSRVNALNIAGGATPTAKLDITNNAFVVDYSGDSPLQTIKSQITSGYNNGAWNGNGITSSNANATNFGIGYAEASALTSVPAIFGAVDSTAVLFRLTRYGDANLDGTVNLSDFNALASNFGGSDKLWHQGDFNYDMIVNLTDFNRLAANFGLSAGPDGPTPDDWAALASVIPEPGSLGLVSAVTLGSLRRRRR